jgi:hypothetical protein
VESLGAMQTGDHQLCLLFVKWVWEHAVPRNDRNVFPALSERRQQDGEDVQPIIQVTAKLPASYHLHEIPICCSYKPDIHFVRATAPYTLEFLLLQDAQQLRLQRRADVAYFVQKQRAFIGHFEAPGNRR